MTVSSLTVLTIYTVFFCLCLNFWPETPSIGVNLSRANLTKADLRKTYLPWANLTYANLQGADLNGACLARARLNHANLSGVDLSGADLTEAKLVWVTLRSKAKLTMAHLEGADLSGARLDGADLSGATLDEANLQGADLSGADLKEATLVHANLVKTNLENTNLAGCRIYGISAWDSRVNEKTKQSGLIITLDNQPTLTVDDIEVAQFIYLLLNRQKLRNVIDTITSKAVLILGRFTPERKAVLDAIADELRKHNLLPIIFDFERATSRDFTETIKTLAGMSLFVIADITNPKSAPLELQATIPDYQIPFVPIIQEGERPFSMVGDLMKYSWVLKPLTYPSLVDLIKVFKRAIIDEAFEMHKKLLMLKAKDMEVRKVEDYLGEK